MTNKAIDKFYDEIAASFGFTKDAEGGWIAKLPGVELPITSKGRQFITPTKDVLKESNWDKYQPFHPLCENIRRKKSIVLEKTQAFAANRLKTVMSEIIIKMIEVALDTDLHDKLTVDQRAFLPLFEKANDKTLKNISGLLTKMLAAAPGESEFIAIGVRRAGSWKGEEYARLTTISFPVMEEEFGETGKIFGHPVTVRDKEIFYSIMRYILPKIDDTEAYCYGTRSEIAPMFHSLMMAYHSVATDLNQITKVLGGIDKEFLKTKHIVTSWSAQMPILYEYKDIIPTLDGNDGEPSKDDVEKETRQQRTRDERKQRESDRTSRRPEPVRSSSAGSNPYVTRRSEPVRESRRDRDERDDYDDRDDRRSRNRFSNRRDDRRDDRRDRDDRSSRNRFSSRGRSRRDDYDDYDDYEDDRRGRRSREPERDENGVTIDRGNRFSSRSRGRDDYDDRDDRRSRRRR